MSFLTRSLLALSGSLSLAAGGFGCAPDIPSDPVPEAMEFELSTTPPRAPEPSSLIVNRETGRIDFSLSGLSLPEDCSQQRALSPAECEFRRYLETLDGYPTSSAARAPVTAPLDLDSVRPGQNLVIVAARGQTPVTDIAVEFDEDRRSLLLRRRESSWTPGEFYWVGLRGYDRGVRAESGAAVVGSPTQFLLKQEQPLTCGASSPADVDPSCPALSLVSTGRTSAEARAALFQLESIRQGYLAGGGFQLMSALGLPKSEIAVLWGFPIHSASVAELDPSAGVVPRVTANGELRVRVQGSIDPGTVSAIAPGVPGSVALVDLTAIAEAELGAAFPPFAASVDDSEVVLAPSQPLLPGHQYGLFFTDALSNDDGVPLVASPVSKLLTLEAELANGSGESLVSTLTDEQALTLEAGRSGLSTLFDQPSFATATGITREHLVYCFAFELPAGAP
jgi:hypothetical protein